MSDPLLSILVGAAASLASIVLIAATLRVRPDWAPVYVFACGIALSEAVTIAIGIMWLEQFYLWPASAIVGAMGIVNFLVFAAVYKSVSLQMLGVLNAQENCCADKNLLIEEVARPAVEQRMELLVKMGLVAKAPDQTYTLTVEGQRTCIRLRKLQQLFGISRCGLYRGT